MSKYNSEIRKAIGAHGIWKAKLRTAVMRGTTETPAVQVQVDNHCEFGKWLYSLPPEARADAHWAKVKNLHAKFHQEAANVLRLVEAGKKTESQHAIEGGSAFENATTQLTVVLMEWSNAA